MYEKSYLGGSAAEAQKQAAYAMTATEACGQTELSAVGAAEVAMNEARDLAFRVMSLVDRIVGSVPQSASPVSSTPEIDGVFPILRRSSERTSEIIGDAQHAIGRLERSLP